MTLEEALRTAIDFEKKVHRVYQTAASEAREAVANKVFATLAREEQGHIAYLESRLGEWQKTGKVTPVALETAIPSRGKIQTGMKKLRARLAPKPAGTTPELGFLMQALQAEHETAAFYERMVAELTAEGQAMFARFVEIEQGHATIVQAEIDSVTGLGYWFDVKEFDLELA